jgi:hypothetical protein
VEEKQLLDIDGVQDDAWVDKEVKNGVPIMIIRSIVSKYLEAGKEGLMMDRCCCVVLMK